MWLGFFTTPFLTLHRLLILAIGVIVPCLLPAHNSLTVNRYNVGRQNHSTARLEVHVPMERVAQRAIELKLCVRLARQDRQLAWPTKVYGGQRLSTANSHAGSVGVRRFERLGFGHDHSGH